MTSRADGTSGFLTGIRLGWDLSHQWGLETRLALASPGVEDPWGQQQLPDADVYFWDASCLYYPLGDTRCRPFFTLGFGLGDFDFFDNQQVRFHETRFNLPLGAGLKYRYSERVALRLEFTDNLTLGSGLLKDTHNLSVTGGVELRLGTGTRRSYWPYNPGHGWW